MTTFSEIVDNVITTTGVSSASKVAGYVNRAITMLRPVNHFSEMKELKIVGCSKSGQMLIPIPTDFRQMLTLQADDQINIVRKNPGLGQLVSQNTHYYYETGEKIAIKGHISRHIKMAYYTHGTKFLYYTRDKRLFRTAECEYPDGAMYEYRVPETDEWLPFNQMDTQHVASYNRHTNRLLMNFSPQIENGATSMGFNAKGDIEIGARLYRQFVEDIAVVKTELKTTRDGEY